MKLPGIGKIEWENEDNDSSFGALDTEDRKELIDLLEKEVQAKGTEVKEGTIVKGNVVRITDDYVIVDIGHKSEGEIPINEFTKDRTEPLTIEVGSELDVYLDRFEDENGMMVLSHERAEILRAWDRLKLAHDNDEVIEGKIIARVKGGLSVDVGVKAFLPGSQVDLRPVRHLDKLINNTFKFKIIKFKKERGNIVLSRRALLEQDRDQLRSITMDNLKEGVNLKGIVKNLTEYGAFIDLGGIDGLLHITDMSWGRINHPSELFEVGQEVEVVVLTYDEARKRVSLGYKQLQDDPWQKAKDNYEVNARTKGKVVSIADYGAFVELEDGIEGLIHISEMSWSKRFKNPSKIVQIGDEVEVVVLAIDSEIRRISLGMKQIEPNPWKIVQEKYLVGDVISGTIRSITDFGVFIGIENGIDGLVHISDISWTERVKHPADKFKKGDEIEAKVLQIDPEAERFSLGIKQLSEDPFVLAAKEMAPGTKAKGIVTKVLEFGAFVEIKPGIEGLIHISEIDDKEVANVSDVVKEGDEVDFVVLATDTEERKFTLSRKAHIKGIEGDSLKAYIGSSAAVEPQTLLGEAFSNAEVKGED